MKKSMTVVVVTLLICLGTAGCGQEGNQEGFAETFVSSITETESGQEQEQENGGGDETAAPDMRILAVSADARETVRNSNKLNFGALSEGSDGSIYYVDKVHNTVMTSGVLGEDARVVYEGKVNALQEADGALYLHLDTGLAKLDPASGETQFLWEKPFGEFLVVGDKVYLNCEEGFCVMNTDGSGREVLLEQPEAVSFMPCENGWLCVESSGTDPSLFWEGHLLFFEENGKEVTQIGTGLNYPLAAGGRIILFNSDTKTSHVWDPETGEDVDLQGGAQKMVSDGENLYYFEDRSNEEKTASALISWDGTSERELAILDGSPENDAVYTAHGWLYWNVRDGEELKWCCLNPETGETGELPYEISD